MNKNLLFVIVAFVLSVLSSQLFAQTDSTILKSRAEAALSKLNDKVQLTDDQKTKLKPLLIAKEGLKLQLANATPGSDSYNQALTSYNANKLQIEVLLTDEQKAKFYSGSSK